MKSVVNNLYQSAVNDLRCMKKSEMALSERVYYEKALAKLDAMKQILDKHNLQQNG